MAVSADGYRLYVSNFMDRTVGVYDLTALIDEGQWNVPLLATLQSVATEKLSPTVLAGKQLFYDARDTRLAREGYMSCASCHNDGGSDGRVWDLTGWARACATPCRCAARAAWRTDSCTGARTSTKCRISKARSGRSPAAPG